MNYDYSFNNKIIMHIGYAKAASSWLQKSIFPEIRNTNFIGRFKDERDDEFLDFCTRLALCEDFHLIERENKYLSETISDSSLNIISHENILRPYDYELAINRVQQIFSGCDIEYVVIIRKQSDILLSRIGHDIQAFEPDRENISNVVFNELWKIGHVSCRWPVCYREKYRDCECLSIKTKRSPRWHYDYYLTWHALKSLVPEEKIHFITFESLFSPPYEGLSRLYSVMGVEIQEEKLATLAMSPKVNESKKTDSLDFFRDQIDEYYADSNRRLEEEAGLYLKKYGYF